MVAQQVGQPTQNVVPGPSAPDPEPALDKYLIGESSAPDYRTVIRLRARGAVMRGVGIWQPQDLSIHVRPPSVVALTNTPPPQARAVVDDRAEISVVTLAAWAAPYQKSGPSIFQVRPPSRLIAGKLMDPWLFLSAKP
jgi:hypothetical protein